jgi:hypothetical protein
MPKGYLDKFMKANKMIFALSIFFLCITGCYQESEENIWEGTKTIKTNGRYDSDGRFRASSQLDYQSKHGSYHRDGTANDYNYKAVTTFDDGRVIYSNNTGQ